MAHTPEEFELSKDVNSNATFEINNSFLANFTMRKNLFTADQEIFIDSQHPLILLNDTNAHTPLPPFCQPPTLQRKRSEKREDVSQILSDLDVDTSIPNLRKIDSGHSGPRKSILKTVASSPSRRRADKSKTDSRDRRGSKISNTMSNPQSDTLGGNNDESEPGSPSKSGGEKEDEEEVDIFHQKEEVKKESNPKLKAKLREFLDSTSLNIFIGIITIYALFAQDFCEAVFTQSTDTGFDVMSLVAMGIFAAEMLLTIYSKKEYFLSFFFWLDLISTVSILFDVDFVINNILYAGVDIASQANQTSVAAKIGTKVGRIFRVVRLIRLVKLYKQFVVSREVREIKKRMQQVIPGDANASHDKSDISQKRDTNFLRSPDHRKSTTKQPRASILALSPLDQSISSPTKARTSEHRGSRVSRGGGAEVSSKNLDKPASSLDVSMVSRRKSVRLTRITTVAPPPAPVKESIADYNLKESRVGKVLSETTTKRVIIITLALLLIIPMLSTDFFFDSPDSQTFQMALLQQLIDGGAPEIAIVRAINTFINDQKSEDPPLVFFQRGNVVYYQDDTVDLSSLRASEKANMTITTTQGTLFSIVNSRSDLKFDAWLGIGRTFFICIVLTSAAVAFNKDARDLVLRPLERIIQKVNKIAKNPLLAKEEELVKEQGKEFDNETIHIENAIVKIGGLLALGFGDAGSAIIAQNIAKSGGDINPMLPGKKKAAIYGFCDIRNFTDATEILQEDVMVFVNSIADVVHSLVDKYAGAANKNIGDAFLLVWKFPEESVMEMSDGQLEIINNQVTMNLADAALISFLKIYARINRDPALLEYRNNEKLNARLPNYKVKMGFGLHVGWAIEGAIGSEFKIDASYLSPNVNMASRLEAATKQYGVPLLFSGDLYEMLTDGMQDISRLIDIVTVKGSIKPIELYTVDMDVEEISIAKDRASQPKELQKVRQKQKKLFIKDLVENESVNGLLDSDKELKHMLRNKSEEFDSIFSQGFDAYIDGDWSIAKKKFEACLAMRSDDGPTKNLVSFLAEYDFICPESWEGYHVLTEK